MKNVWNWLENYEWVEISIIRAILTLISLQFLSRYHIWQIKYSEEIWCCWAGVSSVSRIQTNGAEFLNSKDAERRKCPLIKPSFSIRCLPFKHLRCSVFTGVLEPTNQDNWKRFGVFPLAAAQEFVRHFLYGGVACRAPSLNAKVR